MPISLSPHDRIFVLTGAGISAESGIPTFRGADGLWNGFRVEEVATPGAWETDPELVWRFYADRRRDVSACRPNPAHHALAQLEAALGERFFLCTQNIDNLHELAGSRRVLHMHGELFQSRCERSSPEPGSFARCSSAVFADSRQYRTLAEIPRCACGGRIRPHICWFGEIPFEMDRITEELDCCTMVAVIGTSGTVHPAASFVQWAAQRGKREGTPVRTVYIGPEEPLNAAAFTDIVLGNAGQVLPGLFQVA